MSAPEFPLRLIFDDGESLVVATPEELFEHFHSIDSEQERNRVWIRDEHGRDVVLRMSDGMIRELRAIDLAPR